ncbi:ATP-dependent zinc metalloprotease FtsH 1 [termite gut metagenome]|uniref:ATP-dependent zinc metalloprotease FtsH 1 n=1 Tax=termite gut metagenome TaxID=433724 RepID=A0A5J4S387_9ZZZZ
MATATQLKALIKAHYESDNIRFTTISLQIAAHESKIGHLTLADDIRKIIDKSKQNSPKLKSFGKDFEGLLLEDIPIIRLSDLIVSDAILERIQRIINEYIQIDKLRRYNLQNRRKILLSGPPGTGKTMTASILANELNLPLYTILMDKMVTKFMGETSAKLRQVFDIIQERQGVYLFDEFDAIGTNRGKDNDVGEMRRVLNSFLQFIERDNSNSLIIAATNNLELLDQALFRRFDDVLHYQLPADAEKILLLENRLGHYKGNFDLKSIVDTLKELSHAEISQACLDSIKESILTDKKKVDKSLIVKMIENRKSAYNK